MKVAIILTGHMRCWELLWPQFKSKFIDRYNPDLFVSTWSEEGWWRPNSTKGYNDAAPLFNQSKFIELYKPKVIEVQDYKVQEHYLTEVSKKYSNYIHNPKNVVSMFYKIARGFKLLKDYVKRTNTQYDLVIRMRVDLVFNYQTPDFDTSAFYTPHHPNYFGVGTGDTFQASSYQNMEYFCNAFNDLDATYLKGNTLCPHVLTKSRIEMLNVSHRELSGDFKLVHSPYGHFFDSNETKHSIVFDVGANDAGDSRRFLVKQNMTVHAFEPITPIYDWVTQNVRDPRIVINKLAVDINSGLTTMNIANWEKWHCNSLHEFSDNINDNWKGEYHHHKPNFHYNGVETVQAIRLDEYCKINNIDHIDYLWVSACGNDYRVLQSLGNYISIVKEGRVVASGDVALYKSSNTIEDIKGFLTSHGFICHVEYDNDETRNEAEIFFKK
jgi:FkbM family methyltransferase